MDSPLEKAGFEPLVPRDTTMFSTPAHHSCLTPCTRKSRRERQPTPRGCRAPPAEPMVRILFPPAVSRTKLLGYIGYLSLAKSKAGASFGSNRPAKTVDDSGEGQVEPGLSTSAGRSSSSRGQAASAAPEHWQVSALCRRWASLAEPRRYPLSRPGADVSRCGPHRRVGERFSVIASSLLSHEVGSSLHQLARVALTA